MAEQSRDKAPTPQADKKVPETVLLTADELRAIAGGAGSPPPPNPVSKALTNPQNKPSTPAG